MISYSNENTIYLLNVSAIQKDIVLNVPDYHVVFSFLILSTEEILQYIFPLKESVPQMSFNGCDHFSILNGL